MTLYIQLLAHIQVYTQGIVLEIEIFNKKSCGFAYHCQIAFQKNYFSMHSHQLSMKAPVFLFPAQIKVLSNIFIFINLLNGNGYFHIVLICISFINVILSIFLKV